MDDTSKADISTVCKMLNTSSENEFLKWLPTIPDKDFGLVRVPDDYFLETKIAYIKRLKERKNEIYQPGGIIQIAIPHPMPAKLLEKFLPYSHQKITDTNQPKKCSGNLLYTGPLSTLRHCKRS